MANADGYVIPKPQIPKTLGILNVIFGVGLVLFGLCTIGMTVAAPMMTDFASKKVDEVKSQVEARQKADLKKIDDRMAAAKTDEEKAAIEQERAATIAGQPKLNTFDMGAVTDLMKDPGLMAVSYFGMISGLILHVLLLISGIGLIRLKPWGRSTGLWWGWLQIAQATAYMVAYIFLVLPPTMAFYDKTIAKQEEAAKAPGAGPVEASMVQMTRLQAKMAVPITVASNLTWFVYPIVLLVLLSRPGTRAAVLAKKPESLDAY